MHRHRFALGLICLVIGSTGVIAACSSDDAAPGASSGSSGTPSDTITVHVSAAAGGTVADPSGKTSLTIPPGALAQDTDITLAVVPKSGTAVVDVSEFGPDGLVFLKPVMLSIKGDAALAPEGKSLALAVNEGADFKAVEGSTYANGAATGSIMHFSRYTIVVIDGKINIQPPASCVDARSTFTACGGDPKGTWTFAEFCLPGGDTGGAFPGCPEFSLDVDYTIDREVTIDATTLKVSAGKQKTVATYNYPLVCFNRSPDGGTTYDSGVNDCATVQKKFYTDKQKAGTCVDKAGGYCACTETGEASAEADSSTYTVSGSTITTTNKDGKVSANEFCAKGDLLTVKAPPKDGKDGQLYVLKRK